MSKTETERRAEIAAMTGLDLDGPALVARPERATSMAPASGIEWAPKGIDPHMMPVTDIEFTPEMVEHFPDLSPRNRKAAYTHLFEQYKAYGRNKDRNSLLGRRIGEFLARVHRDRETGGSGFVKGKIALANTLAEHGVTEKDLAEFLAWKAANGE
jgi:hypothetical protein